MNGEEIGSYPDQVKCIQQDCRVITYTAVPSDGTCIAKFACVSQATGQKSEDLIIQIKGVA